MLFWLLDELILSFCYSDLTWKTGEFELTSTITLVLQANRLIKCASPPEPSVLVTPKYASQPSVLVNFIKKETLAQVFSCEFCEISKNTCFYRTRLVAASVLNTNSSLQNFMLLVLSTNFLESCMDILTIGFKSQKLVLIRVKFLTLFLELLKAQYLI